MLVLYVYYVRHLFPTTLVNKFNHSFIQFTKVWVHCCNVGSSVMDNGPLAVNIVACKVYHLLKVFPLYVDRQFIFNLRKISRDAGEYGTISLYGYNFVCIFSIQECQSAMIRCIVDMLPISIRCALLILCELLHVLVKTTIIIFFQILFAVFSIQQAIKIQQCRSYNYIIKHLLYMYIVAIYIICSYLWSCVFRLSLY